MSGHLEACADVVVAAFTKLVHSPANDDGHGDQLAAAKDVLDLGGELDRPDKDQISENIITRDDVTNQQLTKVTTATVATAVSCTIPGSGSHSEAKASTA